MLLPGREVSANFDGEREKNKKEGRKETRKDGKTKYGSLMQNYTRLKITN